MERFIPLSVPNLKGNELRYVIEAVQSEWVSTGGSYIREFERALAEYLRQENAVALQSGTAGLHLAMQMAGVRRETLVIVPTLTFIAAVNPVRYLGAEPIFMDCDDSLCMDPDKLESFCREECRIEREILIHKKTGKEIPALVIVHVFGNMADMEKFFDIAERYHLCVIEDATEALGSRILDGRYAGRFAGTVGDFGVYSFNGNKIITTGGGGAVVSAHPEKLAKIRYLSTQAKDDELYYIHDEVGYNYRMTNLQAALGVAQLEQLEDFIHIKKQNYEHYRGELESIEGLELLPFRAGIRPNYWFYALCIKESYGKTRDELLRHLEEQKIQTRPIWGLIHEQKPYRDCEAYHIEKAHHYYATVLNIPCSSSLASEEVERVIDSLK